MIRTILVPLDGSNFSEQALPLALSIARRAKARVEVIHVHVPVQEYSELLLFDVPLDTKIRKQEKHYLEEVGKKLAKTGVEVNLATKDGHVPEVIKEHAKLVGADLLVMTTHARSAVGRFWLGSVADRLIREIPFPILLLHPQDSAKAHFEQDVRFGNILTPLDGTKAAEGILETAAEFARLFESSMTLARVIKPVLPMTMPMGVASFGEMAAHMTTEIDRMQEAIRKEAADYLEGVAQGLRGRGLKVQTRVEVEDQPARAILGIKGPDMIAMETHGRSGLSRFFLGSVADKVLRGAQTPVLLAHPKK